jgi:hypothetical protein
MHSAGTEEWAMGSNTKKLPVLATARAKPGKEGELDPV